MNIISVNAILDSVEGGGGAERTCQVAVELSKLGHSITLVTSLVDEKTSKRMSANGVGVMVTGLINRRFLIPFPSFNKIRSLIKSCDIIHINGHWTIINSLAYFFAKLENKPYVVSPVGTLKLFGRSLRIKRLYNLFVGRYLIKNAHAHIAVTELEKSDFVNYDVDPSKVIIIPNGVDAEFFNSSDSNKFRINFELGDSPFILFMGRINLIKGPDLLIRAFIEINNKIPSYKLVLAGPDEGLGRLLNDEINKRGLSDKIRLIGFVGGLDKVSAYVAADLLVVPSRHEAMSIVALEAGAAGTPVLVTDQCGFNQVEEMGGGRVVSVDSTAIGKAILELLDNPNELKAAGNRLNHFVKERFSLEKLAVEHINVYKKVLVEFGARDFDK